LRTAAAVLGESHPEAFPGSMADRLPCIRDREEGDQEMRNGAVQIAVTHQESGRVQPPMRLRVTDSFSQCYFFEQRCRRFGVVRPRNLLILTVHRFLRFTVKSMSLTLVAIARNENGIDLTYEEIIGEAIRSYCDANTCGASSLQASSNHRRYAVVRAGVYSQPRSDRQKM
jgi:hypothetical protein